MVEDTDNHGSEPKGGGSWRSKYGPTEAKQTPTERGSRLPQAITSRECERWGRTGVASGVDGDNRPCRIKGRRTKGPIPWGLGAGAQP